MATNLTPALHGPSTALTPAEAPTGVAYRPTATPGATPVPAEAQIGRIIAAINRHKWVIGLCGALGATAGFTASRFVEPAYTVQSTLLLTSGLRSLDNDDRGPIQQDQTLDPQGWLDLLKTGAIADSVVLKLALYVEPERARDSAAFRNFQLNYAADRFFPGEYTLNVHGSRWTLREKIGVVNDSGAVGDSIGRSAGFAWRPAPSTIRGNRTIKFIVRQPREASVNILSRLRVGLAKGSNLIFLQLGGTAQQKPAETLNAWDEQFIRIANGLKTERLSQSMAALGEQRAEAEQKLLAADRAYEQYRVATIALPSEALSINTGPGGVTAVQQDPVLSNYTSSKYQLEGLRRERTQLERVAASLKPDSIPVDAFLNVGLVNSDPAAIPLKNSLGEVIRLDGDIRLLRRTQQDRNPQLAAVLEQRSTLANRVIPQQVASYLGQLRLRERQVGSVVTQSTGELQAIPQRNTEGESLRRNKDAAAVLFNNLNARYTEAQLAQKSVTPVVRVFDRAVLPSRPNANTLSRLIVFGLVAGLGLGLGVAVLRDRLDRRFRYPTQVTHELGLQILGVVPAIDQSRQQGPEKVAQIIEAFRALRMNVRYAAAPAERVALTVTSPSPSDGKSLIASNLALSFAEGGWRTVIVDGDLRRGELHTTFGLAEGPGLIEYLEGTMLLGEVLQPTAHDNLTLIATGKRHRRGPELLATPRMRQLVLSLLAEYDAVIVDSPPLGAGTDAYVLAAATESMALVLRRAATDLRMAAAKLETLDTLPVQVIGAVLNEVEAEARMYQHYSYDPDYVLVEGHEDESGADGADPRSALTAGPRA